MGNRSVTLRDDCDCSLVVCPLVVGLLLLEERLLLLLFSLLLDCGDVKLLGELLLLLLLVVLVGGRWATAVRMEVLAKRRASNRT